MKNLKENIIVLVENHSRSLIGIFTLFILVLGFGVTKLEQQFSQKSWFRDGDPYITKYEEFKKEYGNDKNLILILKFKETIFKENNLKRVYDITEKIWTLPNFIKVDSLSNYSYTSAIDDEIDISPFIMDPEEKPWSDKYLKQKSEKAKSIKAFKRFLISDDQKTAIIYAGLRHKDGQGKQISRDSIAALKKNIISKFKSNDLEFMITGSGAIAPSFEELTTKDMTIIGPLALLILVVILSFILKNIIATMISVGIISITIIGALGAQGWLGIKLDLITALCPLIVLAICVADIVHILTSYLESSNEKGELSIRVALDKNLYPTFLTSMTTTLGFLSFMTADLNPIVDMGIVSACGITLAWIMSVFLLCPLLHLIPIKVTAKNTETKPLINTKPLLNFIINNSKLIVGVVMLLTITSVYLSQKNVVDSNMQNYFKRDTPLRLANEHFNNKIGGSNAIELIVDSGESEGIQNVAFLNKLDRFVSDVNSVRGVTKVLSIIEQLKEVNQVMNGGKKSQYAIADTNAKIAQELFFLDISLPPEKSIFKVISADKSRLRISIFWNRTSSLDILEGGEKLKTLLSKHGLKGHITGSVPLNAALDGYIINSFAKSMITAIVFISILMMLVFKSFWFGLFSMIPNIIVPSFGTAVLYLLGRHFDAASILIFSICLGIAIDDTIYFLTNLKTSMAEKKEVEETVGNVLEHAGVTLSYTTLILVSIFSLFFFGSFVPNDNFAIATTVILTSALALDLIFLPALIILIEKSRWITYSFTNFK